LCFQYLQSFSECLRQRLPSVKRYRWEFQKRGKEVAVDVPAALKEGRLITVLENWCPPISGLFLYFSGNRHVPAALRALIEMVREKSA
jgi:hypothetical protein